jgi:hypothetical protein
MDIAALRKICLHKIRFMWNDCVSSQGHPMNTSRHSLEHRLDRLESLDEIRQLVAKYSLSLDMRDLDAHVNLFAHDIRISRDKTGRAHMKAWLDDTLRLQFTGTSHHTGNHIIEFDEKTAVPIGSLCR